MKVTIGGVSYDIVYEDTRKAIAPNKPIGQIDYLKNKIQIYKHMTVCRKRRSLMHEIVHGIIVGYHLKDLVHDDGRHNEAAVDLLAIGIVEAIESLGLCIPVEANGSRTRGQMLDSLIKLITKV